MTAVLNRRQVWSKRDHNAEINAIFSFIFFFHFFSVKLNSISFFFVQVMLRIILN